LICGKTKINHYNATDKCWYSYTPSSKEYRKHCGEGWISLGMMDDIFYPESMGIWIKIDKTCHSLRLTQSLSYQKSCVSDKDPTKGDENKCSENEACRMFQTETGITFRCVPCNQLDVVDCENHPHCAKQKWITAEREKEKCAPRLEASRIFCLDHLCDEGKSCCIVERGWWVFSFRAGVCYDPKLVECKNREIFCKESGCDVLCKSKNRGKGSCSYRSDTPYVQFIELEKVGTIACYCELPSPSECEISISPREEEITLSPADFPFEYKKQFTLTFRSCPSFKLEVVDEANNVVWTSKEFSNPSSSEESVSITVSFSVSKFEKERRYVMKVGEKQIGEIKIKINKQTFLRIYLEPAKDKFALNEQVKIRLKGYTEYQLTEVRLWRGFCKPEELENRGSVSKIGEFLPGSVIDTIAGEVTFMEETPNFCFRVKGKIPYTGELIESNTICVEVRGIATTTTISPTTTISKKCEKARGASPECDGKDPQFYYDTNNDREYDLYCDSNCKAYVCNANYECKSPDGLYKCHYRNDWGYRGWRFGIYSISIFPSFEDGQPAEECFDGYDNDCDGKKDCADPRCAGQINPNNPNEICCQKHSDCPGRDNMEGKCNVNTHKCEWPSPTTTTTPQTTTISPPTTTTKPPITTTISPTTTTISPLTTTTKPPTTLPAWLSCKSDKDCEKMRALCIPPEEARCIDNKCVCISEKERYELILKEGWNLVSIPFKKFEIVQIGKEIDPFVGTLNPSAYSDPVRRYDMLDIRAREFAEELKSRGFWIFSGKDNEKIVIKGVEELEASEIALYADPSKPYTLDQIAIPKGGLHVMSQKGDCEIVAFYHYDATEKNWYKWDATSKEYLKWNDAARKYEAVKKTRTHLFLRA
jgi:hypothetical protein